MTKRPARVRGEYPLLILTNGRVRRSSSLSPPPSIGDLLSTFCCQPAQLDSPQLLFCARPRRSDRSHSSLPPLFSSLSFHFQRLPPSLFFPPPFLPPPSLPFFLPLCVLALAQSRTRTSSHAKAESAHAFYHSRVVCCTACAGTSPWLRALPSVPTPCMPLSPGSPAEIAANQAHSHTPISLSSPLRAHRRTRVTSACRGQSQLGG
mmetsp:Transcript_27623/g.70629  ORF Transcript_27623/g.70629 Transcript_27623/m.70629 type:complete len:206 (-) Transcript_27623:1650-2267(-)